jgi:hypothetical protein
MTVAAEARLGSARRSWPNWSWFAGADRPVLALVPCERDFMEALGLVVFVLGLASGFVLDVAASGWWSVSIWHVMWIGAAWSVVIWLIERLVLKSFGTRRRWYPLILVPRVALTLAIAFVFATPTVQLIFRPSIADQLNKTATQQARQATQAANEFYGPKIKAAQTQIRTIKDNESALRGRIDRFNRLSGCEANEPSCSHTHQLGCENWCRFYRNRAVAARTELNDAKPHDRRTIGRLRAKARAWQSAETREVERRHKAIRNDVDMLTRQEALSAIERKHPEVSNYVLFVLLLFIFLDLVPLIMKVFHLLTTGAAYEEAAAALRELDGAEAHRLRAESTVEKRKITEQAQADEEVAAVEITLERDKRIAEAEAAFEGSQRSSDAPGSQRRSPSTPRISALDLDGYLEAAKDHESHPVAVPAGLARGGWVATGLIAAITGAIWFYTLQTHEIVTPGGWLALALLGVASALIIYTKGFRIAPAWALRATLGLLISSVALPLLILVVNVIGI